MLKKLFPTAPTLSLAPAITADSDSKNGAAFERSIGRDDVREKITIDKSAANTAAFVSVQANSGLPIQMRR